MNMAARKVATHKPVQDPYPTPNKHHDAWLGELALLQSQTDPHQAALGFTKCCEILQVLVEEGVFTADEHLKKRSMLMSLWAECVKRIEQPGAVTVTDQQRSE